ncbi:unnamed protein product [Brassica rapa]|uniref:Uncharacterized protein n=1 Tax=Brassica campestris TaxID=3711 RepID=A0A3P5ZB48_BRACM|nr:unnamed protein product [Brassica rapa]VDC69981.1 unnamed protein product [Brassica rapa]
MVHLNKNRERRPFVHMLSLTLMKMEQFSLADVHLDEILSEVDKDNWLLVEALLLFNGYITVWFLDKMEEYITPIH